MYIIKFFVLRVVFFMYMYIVTQYMYDARCQNFAL